MAQPGSFDVQLVAALAAGVALLACVVVLYAIRDRRSFPWRKVSRTVWCSLHKREATVDVEERMVTGLLDRRVTDCPIRNMGERCDESCRDELTLASATRRPLH